MFTPCCIVLRAGARTQGAALSALSLHREANLFYAGLLRSGAPSPAGAHGEGAAAFWGPLREAAHGAARARDARGAAAEARFDRAAAIEFAPPRDGPPPRDDDDARRRSLADVEAAYTEAAGGGCGRAAYNLALWYLDGRHGRRADPARARRLLEAAAADGVGAAMAALALMMVRGQGGFPHEEWAKDWRRIRGLLAGGAADGTFGMSGDHPFVACYTLGLLYARGRGGPVDVDAALKWFTRCADAGVARPREGDNDAGSVATPAAQLRGAVRGRLRLLPILADVASVACTLQGCMDGRFGAFLAALDALPADALPRGYTDVLALMGTCGLAAPTLAGAELPGSNRLRVVPVPPAPRGRLAAWLVDTSTQNQFGFSMVAGRPPPPRRDVSCARCAARVAAASAPRCFICGEAYCGLRCKRLAMREGHLRKVCAHIAADYLFLPTWLAGPLGADFIDIGAADWALSELDRDAAEDGGGGAAPPDELLYPASEPVVDDAALAASVFGPGAACRIIANEGAVAPPAMPTRAVIELPYVVSLVATLCASRIAATSFPRHSLLGFRGGDSTHMPR